MPLYAISSFDRSDRVVSQLWIDATDDSDAIRRARMLEFCEPTREIRQGNRLIAVLREESLLPVIGPSQIDDGF